jgi:FkbM family methyltransferase
MSDAVEMVPAVLNGEWELVLPQYRAELYARGPWEVERLRSMHALLEPGMVLYDIGTETGDLSSLFAKWVEPGGVVLFEPNPRAWPNVRAIWEANDAAPPLGCFVGFANDFTELRDIAATRTLGDWPGAASLAVCDDHGMWELCHQPAVEKAAHVRIDDAVGLLGVPAPDAITIDVEGAELLVVQGAMRTLREDRPIVWASVHERLMADAYQETAGKLLQTFLDIDYSVEFLGCDHESHYLFRPR